MKERRIGRIAARRSGRRKHPRVGPRVFVFFLVLTVLIGAAAIALNLNFENLERGFDTSRHAPDATALGAPPQR